MLTHQLFARLASGAHRLGRWLVCWRYGQQVENIYAQSLPEPFHEINRRIELAILDAADVAAIHPSIHSQGFLAELYACSHTPKISSKAGADVHARKASTCPPVNHRIYSTYYDFLLGCEPRMLWGKE